MSESLYDNVTRHPTYDQLYDYIVYFEDRDKKVWIKKHVETCNECSKISKAIERRIL